MFAKKKLCAVRKKSNDEGEMQLPSNWILYVLTAETAFTYALDKLSKREHRNKSAICGNFQFSTFYFFPAREVKEEFQAFRWQVWGHQRERLGKRKWKLYGIFNFYSRCMHMYVMAFRTEAMTLTENLHQPTRDRSYVACWSRSTSARAGWLKEEWWRVRWVGGGKFVHWTCDPKLIDGRKMSKISLIDQ